VGKWFILLGCFLAFNAGAQSNPAVSDPVNTVIISVDSSQITLNTFPEDFKQRYREAEFIYEFKAPEKNAWDRFKEWLADIFRNFFNFTNDEDSMHAVEIVLKTIAVLLVVFVIYLIAKALLNKEGRWIFGRSSDTKIIRHDDIAQNIHLQDFRKLIATAKQSHDKRLVIRYYYLWLLQKMTDRQLIEWDIEKTNSDYYREIKSAAAKDRFAYVSYLYDYVWYGEFELDDATYQKTCNAFENAIQSVGNE
jgi:hypothetical protein